jgi:hypothetical protein
MRVHEKYEQARARYKACVSLDGGLFEFGVCLRLRDVFRGCGDASFNTCLIVPVMQKAWRERNPQARIRAAYQAIEMNHE